MTEIEKQTIFNISLKEINKIKIVKKENWYDNVVRNWGNKKDVERVLFNLEGNEHQYFECDKEFADKIMEYIDTNKSIAIIDLSFPQMEQKKRFINLWKKLKSFIGR